MTLRIMGVLSLFLLLIQPAKADSTDDFTFDTGLGEVFTFSLPSTTAVGGPWAVFEPDVSVPNVGTIPYTVEFDLVPLISTGVTTYEMLMYCDVSFPIDGPHFDFCDPIWGAGFTASPFSIQDNELTFIPGDYLSFTGYGELTIVADTPEPAVLGLLGIGFFSLVAFKLFARRSDHHKNMGAAVRSMLADFRV